eukprot:6180176-Pleurochrysis_carterae.AAC.5
MPERSSMRARQDGFYGCGKAAVAQTWCAEACRAASAQSRTQEHLNGPREMAFDLCSPPYSITCFPGLCTGSLRKCPLCYGLFPEALIPRERPPLGS